MPTKYKINTYNYYKNKSELVKINNEFKDVILILIAN